MPFLMEVDEACRRIRRGLDSDAFEIAFPRRFALLLKPRANCVHDSDGGANAAFDIEFRIIQ